MLKPFYSFLACIYNILREFFLALNFEPEVLFMTLRTVNRPGVALRVSGFSLVLRSSRSAPLFWYWYCLRAGGNVSVSSSSPPSSPWVFLGLSHIEES